MTTLLPDFSEFENHPPDALVRTGYVSLAKEPLGKDDLDDILEASLRNNRALDVGGVLITNQVKVFQILEGPCYSVKLLLEKIAEDSRHHDLKIFSVTAVEERGFEKWEMAVRSLTFESPLQRDAFDTIFGVFANARIPLALDERRVVFFRNLAETTPFS